MEKKNSIAVFVGLMLFAILLSGCTSQYPSSNTPTLTITQPQSGSTISGSDLMVMIQVTNFNIVDKQGQPAVSGEGHVHYYLDYDAPTTQGQPAVPPSGVTWQTIASTTFTFHNVTAGSHFVSVELVNNDHTPLNPAVTAKVTITMTSGSGTPTLTILQPQSGSTVTSPNVSVSIQVSNFNIVDKQGQPAVSGEGHVHYYLDYDAPTTQGKPAVPPNGTIWQTIASTTYTFHNVTTGTHFVSVELVNNDHTPLNPPVTAKVSFTVSSQGGGQTYNVYLMAKNIAFNLSTITVPAGANIVIHFTNDDAGTPHNFALYDSSARTTNLFKGDIIDGVSSIDYTFTAPSTPGTYFFQCDVHPNLMNGDFVVT